MNSTRVLRRPETSLYITRPKDDIAHDLHHPALEVPSGGTLTPDVPTSDLQPSLEKCLRKIGKYILKDLPASDGSVCTCSAFNLENQSEQIVKVIPTRTYPDYLAPYWSVGDHPNIKGISELFIASKTTYAIFDSHIEDLHSYIRRKRRLREPEAIALFRQIVSAVHHCHSNGVVVRDVKLRKFVFRDSGRTQLLLDGLEEGHVLEDEDNDQLTDKHGCLAYVSPEILYSSNGYSGKAADMWSLGVVLYTMLVGQYPFHDADVGTLFKKIRVGSYQADNILSAKAKCLLRNLLRTEPSERLNIEDVLQHPWFNLSCYKQEAAIPRVDPNNSDHDQMVPNVLLPIKQYRVQEHEDESTMRDIFTFDNGKVIPGRECP